MWFTAMAEGDEGIVKKSLAIQEAVGRGEIQEAVGRFGSHKWTTSCGLHKSDGLGNAGEKQFYFCKEEEAP